MKHRHPQVQSHGKSLSDAAPASPVAGRMDAGMSLRVATRSREHRDHAGDGAIRAARCHDIRCHEADEEIRDLLRRY